MALKDWTENDGTWVKSGKREVVFISQSGTDRFTPYWANDKMVRGKAIKKGKLTYLEALAYAKKYMEKN